MRWVLPPQPRLNHLIRFGGGFDEGGFYAPAYAPGELVEMTPEEFLGGVNGPISEAAMKKLLIGAEIEAPVEDPRLNPWSVDRLRERLRNGEEIDPAVYAEPIPGREPEMLNGMHRAAAAYLEGLPKMPVIRYRPLEV